MEEITKTFGVNWKLLIAQGVNFIIVMAILWYFVAKPLIKMMDKRSSEIKDGLDKSEKIKVEYQKLDEMKLEKVAEGEEEADKIVAQVNKEVEKIRQEKLKEVERQANQIIEEAKTKITDERREMQQEVKEELAELVLMVSGKIHSKAISAETHQELIDDAITEVETKKV